MGVNQPTEIGLNQQKQFQHIYTEENLYAILASHNLRKCWGNKFSATPPPLKPKLNRVKIWELQYKTNSNWLWLSPAKADPSIAPARF